MCDRIEKILFYAPRNHPTLNHDSKSTPSYKRNTQHHHHYHCDSGLLIGGCIGLRKFLLYTAGFTGLCCEATRCAAIISVWTASSHRAGISTTKEPAICAS